MKSFVQKIAAWMTLATCLGVFAVAVLFCVFTIRYETIRPGYVGIKVPLQGSKEDKTEYNLVYGRVWYNSFWNDIYVFPTFMQQVVWTRDPQEGSPVDESISFSSTEGKSINCDVALAYSIDADFVPHIFRDQRKKIEEITAVYLRSKVRNAFVRHAGDMPVHDIIGSGKSGLIDAVKRDLVTELGPKGYIIDMVSVIGDMRVDEKVKTAINATIEAQLKAVEAQNKIQQSEAEAKQEIAKAEGKAKSMLAEAEGKAKSIKVVAEAEAEANRALQETITPVVLQYNMLKTWDGKMPMVTAPNALPLISFDPFAPAPKPAK